MKHNPNVTAHALAVTTAIIYVICRVGFLVAPELSMAIGRSWFHGIDISLIAARGVPPGSFVLGLVSATIGAWLVGYLFANLYNFFLKK